jgi:hypothetical protein
MSSLLVFKRVYRLEIQSVLFGIIDPFCRLLPLYLLSGLAGTEEMAASMVC